MDFGFLDAGIPERPGQKKTKEAIHDTGRLGRQAL